MTVPSEKDVLEALKEILRQLKPKGCRVTVKSTKVLAVLGLPYSPTYKTRVCRILESLGATPWSISTHRRVYLIEGELLRRLLDELDA